MSKLVIKPMLAMASPPFDSSEHLFELKWDGTRCIAFIDKKGVRLQNRRLFDITYRYPEFQVMKKGLRVESAVLDGEIVVLEGGRPVFERLQQREHIEDKERIEILSGLIPATYIVFDLLYLNRKPLIERPLVERRRLLEGLFPLSENLILSETYTEGIGLFKEAVRAGFEGIMAKEKDSPYLPGIRSRYWLKIKKAFDIDAVVCGFIRGKRGRPFSSLILGLYEEGRLIHIGQVGTGFDEDMVGLLMKRLNLLKTDRSPFDTPVGIKGVVQWCRPLMVVRIGYQELTKDRKLRVPVFKNIRDDKDPEECIFIK
ncbi:MAG: non-homologous end-joining DNA ligase [Thermodesulfovibrionales bacterium]